MQKIWLHPARLIGVSDTLLLRSVRELTKQSVGDRRVITNGTRTITFVLRKWFGTSHRAARRGLRVQEPALGPPLAVARGVEATELVLIEWRESLLLAVEELALVSRKTAPWGGVVLADTARLGRDWPFRGHVGRLRRRRR